MVDWINLGAPDDSIYQNFYNYIMNSNIADFSYIRELIENNQFEQALQENNNIIAENTHEANLQFINDVYLNYIATGEEMPQLVVDGLWDLAGLTPWIGGEAVYTARIILGYDPDEHSLPYKIANPEKKDEFINKIKLIPNPTTGITEIRFPNNTISNSKIIIYNTLGMVVKSLIIDRDNLSYNIDITDIKNGIYFISIVNNECKEVMKLIKN